MTALWCNATNPSDRALRCAMLPHPPSKSHIARGLSWRAPLLVGEANPYQEEGDLEAHARFALYPEPEQSAGGRLCRVILGLTPRAYLGSYERVNLCGRKWSLRAARERADAILLEREIDDAIVLLGTRVCAAFGVPFTPFELAHALGRRPLAILPHPSGRNLAWNHPLAVDRARRVIESIGGRLA